MVGIRGKLFFVSILLIITVGLAVQFYLEYVLRGWIESRIESELLLHTKAMREFLVHTDGTSSLAVMDGLADRYGRAIDKRITIIADDGRVLGDSGITLAAVRTIENHGGRPEVQAAISNGVGIARRFSTTLGVDMLYVAIPFAHKNTPPGVVRVEVPLTQVDKLISKLRWFLMTAGFLGLIIAIIIAGIASHLLTLTLRRLLAHARNVMGSEAHLLPVHGDEISGLAGSFNHLFQELDQTVASLSQERYFFKAVLEGMNEAVFVLDRDLRITLVNRAGLAMAGGHEQLIDKLFVKILPATSILDLSQAIASGKTLSAQFDLTPDRHLLVQVTPQYDGCIVVMHDISDIHRSEQVRRQFVSDVSHELRTPVSIILGYADTVLAETSKQAITYNMLSALQKNAVRLANVINDLLDLSRLDADHYPLNIETIVINQQIEQLAEAMAHQLMTKQIQLINAADLAMCVMADVAAMSQILLNLVDNAIKYTPAGGTVTIRTRCLGEYIRIEIEDNGPGIEMHHRRYIFERFYRVDSGRSRAVGGTGLGLSIVKNLTEAMCGNVGVDFVVPHGSVFWVALPVSTC